MTRKKNGPKDPKNGAGTRGSGSENAPKDGDRAPSAPKNGSNVVSMTSSPAFDTWLDRQTKKLFQATSTKPNEALEDLIRNWPDNNHKK